MLNSAAQRLPLEGITVLDLTQMASGPYATMLLAEAGANVVKIERPEGGDPSRMLPPFVHNERGRRVGAGILRFGRHKRSLALDLTSDGGKEIFRELVRVSDVVWENFVPGTMERLGLGYEALQLLNSRLIYGCISGFGRGNSPESGRAALDIVAQAESGLMDVSGDTDGPPALVGAVIGDLVPALYGVIATLLALRQRESDGKGALIDISMVDSLIAINERAIVAASLTGETIRRGNLGHGGPYGRFRTRDGEMVIGASIPTLWKRLCRAIGRADLLEQAPAEDAAHVWWRFGDVLRPVLSAWAAERSTSEALKTLHEHGVPAASVATVNDVLSSAHARSRQMFVESNDEVAGNFAAVGPPFHVSSVRRRERGVIPALGRHSRDVLIELLGYSEERIDALVREKVVSEPESS